MITDNKCNTCENIIHADFMSNEWCPSCERNDITDTSVGRGRFEDFRKRSMDATKDNSFEFLREYL